MVVEPTHRVRYTKYGEQRGTMMDLLLTNEPDLVECFVLEEGFSTDLDHMYVECLVSDKSQWNHPVKVFSHDYCVQLIVHVL